MIGFEIRLWSCLLHLEEKFTLSIDRIWALAEIHSVFNVDAYDHTAKCSVYRSFTIGQRLVQFRLLLCPFSEHSTSLVRQIPQYTFHIEEEFL